MSYGNTDIYNGYFSVTANGLHTFGFRWHQHSKPGKWLVHIMYGRCWADTAAVVDDFGSLVAV